MAADIFSSRYDFGKRVAIEWEEDGGFAYRPGEVIVRGADAAAFVQALIEATGGDPRPPEPFVENPTELPSQLPGRLSEFARFTEVVDPQGIVRAAVAAGFHAQLNHVLFADNCSCGDCCPPHPSLVSRLGSLAAAPFWVNPFSADPFWLNAFNATPFWVNPFGPNAGDKKGPPFSSVAPADDPNLPTLNLPKPTGSSAPSVTIFDTGVAQVPYRPGLFDSSVVGDPDLPDSEPDGYLDCVAGHGSFIAGEIELRSPWLDLECRKLIEPEGDCDEWAVAHALLFWLIDRIVTNQTARLPYTVFNMSFSGYLSGTINSLLVAFMVALVQAFGIVVVASAGNLASCRRAYPAAFPGVIGVGALGPCGPAPWTSYGPWVRACAPGVDIVSAFFDGFNGSEASVNGVDPDDFHGWARWSGTSFAAPIVVAALTLHMRFTGQTAKQAVAAVVDAPHLARIPCLGTVINL